MKVTTKRMTKTAELTVDSRRNACSFPAIVFRIPVGKVTGLHLKHLNEIRCSLYLTVLFREAVKVAVGHFLQVIPGYVALTE